MMNKHILDLTNQKIGRLTVLSLSDQRTPSGKIMWLCKCDCGKEHIASADTLLRAMHGRYGGSRSCGCFSREYSKTGNARRKYPQKNSRLYRIWKGMKARCYCPNTESYKRWYGAKGITVCDEWRNDFAVFQEWALNNGYADNLSIDRIDNNGNYEPTNCRWATDTMQAKNTKRDCKKVKILETNEIYKSIHECARAINVPAADISAFLHGKRKQVKGLHFVFVEIPEGMSDMEVETR